MITRSISEAVVAYISDIEKCFDSLWLEDCINSRWDNDVNDGTLSLIYNLNVKANITIKTPFRDTQDYLSKTLSNRGQCLDLF